MTCIYIHGYSYSIEDGDSPERQYRYWDNFVDDETIRYRWQSMPPGGNRLASFLTAISEGRMNTYSWAWAEAINAAQRVARIIDEQPEPINIVCHSLGSRVAYEAARLRPRGIHTILTLNGADSVDHARDCAYASLAEIYSVMTRADGVLRWLGRTFTPVWGFEHVVGYDGLGDNAPDNWHEILLEKEGDGPGWADHDYSFKNPKLWPRWRAILG